MSVEDPRIVLFGDDIGIPQLLDALSRWRPVAIVGAGIRPEQHESLRHLAKERGLPMIVQPGASSPDYPAFVRDVTALEPAFILVNSYSMLLTPEVLCTAKIAAVNVHGGILPEYRGANPIQWALINDERASGVTMHHMTARFDEGDIIAQRKVPVDFHDTWVDLRERIASATKQMLGHELPRLLAGKTVARPQDPKAASYYRHRTPQDGLIDWEQPALNIYNHIRALVHPLPGAFYEGMDGIQQISDWTPIGTVMALKFGTAGGHRLLCGPFDLIPQPFAGHANRVELNSAVTFRVVDRGDADSQVVTVRFDWQTRTARIEEDQRLPHELVRYLEQVVSDEVGCRLS